ncbi:toll/interleukin-1 receptor domain-containing protein [Paraburkholderia elongata]|uniref:TIR domain-containing protein n=1 Tax=Paraburkholderia elongata TaxID=2675747 RepID=A0A972SMK2_9BURK|nr:toll/interleukin-1 receptor domain-containing protein [Paraburkholderia elongata]NPT56730.1 TIR domain-containing protein [Paraburkholderia elongata]
MATPFVFLSYKHGDPWTRIAKRFHTRLRAVSKGMGFQLFMDDKVIKGGDLWSDEVEHSLEKSTHFIAMLCDEYWESEQCQRELLHAVKRYEASKVPRLLFVLVEMMRPEYLTFDEARQSGTLSGKNKKLEKVSDVHFLGPFDDKLRLERLEWNDASRLSDQLAQLVDRIEITLKAG